MSLLRNLFLSVIESRTLGFRRRRYGRLFLATAELFVFCSENCYFVSIFLFVEFLFLVFLSQPISQAHTFLPLIAPCL